MEVIDVKDAVLYVISLSPPTGVHLNKVLWFADKESYSKRQQRVTTAEYIKNHFGPTVKGLPHIIDELEYRDRYITRRLYSHDDLQYTEYLMQDEGNKYLETRAIPEIPKKYIDDVFSATKSYSASRLSDMTHDDFYEMTPLFNKMPIELTTVKYREATEREIEYAESAVERLNSAI